MLSLGISYPVLSQSKDNTLTYATTRNHKSKQNNNNTKLNNKSNVDLNLPVKTVSRKANCESSPSKNSIKKKSTDHNCEGVMVKMASG